MDFKKLKITTMTLIFELEGKIDLRSAMYLLPITKINVNTEKSLAKYIVPLCNNGDIITLQYGPIIRGFIRKLNKRFFKNSIGVYMSTSTKNLSFKISPNTFQLCGASSRANGLEAANAIINHLNIIYEMQLYIRNNKQDYIDCVSWLKSNSLGDLTEKTIVDQYVFKNLILNVSRKVNDYILIAPKVIPGHLNSIIMKFLLLLIVDVFYYNVYIDKIENVINTPMVYDNQLKLNCTNEVMVNYNYNLGFKVDLNKLDDLIYLRNGLYSYYDNALVNCVTVELPYQPELFSYAVKKAKKGIPHHTFLIYASGAVTQSGPCSSTQPGACSYVMEEAYTIFMNSIEEIKDQIKI